jgi:hypothetical protein
MIYAMNLRAQADIHMLFSFAQDHVALVHSAVQGATTSSGTLIDFKGFGGTECALHFAQDRRRATGSQDRHFSTRGECYLATLE